MRRSACKNNQQHTLIIAYYNKFHPASSIIIPHDQLSPEALKGVVEEFVTRDGTDYGGSEVSLEIKAMQVMNQLHTGKAVIVFDQKSQTCNILPNDSSILTAMKKKP